MKMSELIARYGDHNVRFQKLDDCADSLNMGKKATKITFSTDQRIDLKGTEQLGLILWFDREKLAAAVAALKAEGLPAGGEQK